jgi:hypothetical protein
MQQTTAIATDASCPVTSVLPKVIIHVEGGLVQSVYSTEELDVQIFDLDISDFATKPEIEATAELAADFKTQIRDLQQIY